MRPSTPTSTLFPYTTLFRSETRSKRLVHERDREQDQRASRAQPRLDLEERAGEAAGGRPLEHGERRRGCDPRSEEHTSELQSLRHLVCRLLLEKKNIRKHQR